MAIAEQMGITLQNVSYSVNIKERLDFSCALFDPAGSLIANAPHVPVHLGSMSEAVQAVIRSRSLPHMRPGDVYMLNAPYSGGTHIPDGEAQQPPPAGGGARATTTAASCPAPASGAHEAASPADQPRRGPLRASPLPVTVITPVFSEEAHALAAAEAAGALPCDDGDGDGTSGDPSEGAARAAHLASSTKAWALRPLFFVASRGHHSEIGGVTPGSMPPFSRTIEEEGILFRDFLLVDRGTLREAPARRLFANHRYPRWRARRPAAGRQRERERGGTSGSF